MSYYKGKVYDRVDNDHNVLRNGPGYSAERAHGGKIVVGFGKTVEEAIADCDRKIAEDS